MSPAVMKNLVLALLFLSLVACGGGGDSQPDAGDGDSPDATENPDAADQADADLADAACVSATECDGASDGEVLCAANAVVTCTEVSPGCFTADLVDCGDDTCVDDGTPECVPDSDLGESCNTAMPITADTVISGADFEADFADDQDFTDDSCEEGDSTDANVEAVFSVTLAANQGVIVTETGGLDAIIGIQTTCGDAEACLAALDEPETLSFLATEPTTIFIYVGAYFAGATDDYSIAFTFTECGDGALADNEECDDDGVAADDGCSSACTLEFGFTCDTAVEPTACTAFPDLGDLGGGDSVVEADATTIPTDESAFYTITFTEPVTITGTLTATTGDPDLEIYSATQLLYAEEDGGDETIGDGIPVYLPPGTYVLRILAFDELTDGFTLDLDFQDAPHTDIGSFAAAATIADTVQDTGMADGDIDRYTVTFTGDVLLTGSLTADPSGDLDLYVWQPGDFVFDEVEVGDESFTDQPLPANTYYLEVIAYDAVDGYTLSLSTTAP
jgi:cysteine-rich repeat protein